MKCFIKYKYQDKCYIQKVNYEKEVYNDNQLIKDRIELLLHTRNIKTPVYSKNITIINIIPEKDIKKSIFKYRCSLTKLGKLLVLFKILNINVIDAYHSDTTFYREIHTDNYRYNIKYNKINPLSYIFSITIGVLETIIASIDAIISEKPLDAFTDEIERFRNTDQWEYTYEIKEK